MKKVKKKIDHTFLVYGGPVVEHTLNQTLSDT